MSFTEVLIIAILALVLLGPDNLPGALKTIGKGLRELRRAGDGLRQQVEDELGAVEKPAIGTGTPIDAIREVRKLAADASAFMQGQVLEDAPANQPGKKPAPAVAPAPAAAPAQAAAAHEATPEQLPAGEPPPQSVSPQPAGTEASPPVAQWREVTLADAAASMGPSEPATADERAAKE